MRWFLALRSMFDLNATRCRRNDHNLRAKPMQSLSKNIHTIILTLAIAVAIAGFAASGAIAQATKLVFEERASDSKVAQVFETTGRVEIAWRATGGAFQLTVLDPKDDSKLVATAPQSRDNDDAPPMVGKLPFSRPGPMKFQIEAAGPWHVRVVQFNAPQ